MQAQSLKPIEFADYLLERRVLDEAQLLDALADHWLHNSRLADAIVSRGYLPREQVDKLVEEFENLHVVYV